MPARVLVWTGPRPKSRHRGGGARGALPAAARGVPRGGREPSPPRPPSRRSGRDVPACGCSAGSGVFGLAAMRPAIAVGDVTIVRPFLDVPRARLAATTAAAGLEPVDDPMNTDPRFARARIRRLMPLLAAEGIDPARLAATARRLADAADAIDAAATALIAEAVDGRRLRRRLARRRRASPRRRTRSRCGRSRASCSRRRRGLSAALRAARGARSRRWSRTTASGRFKRTLAGTVVEWRGGRFALLPRDRPRRACRRSRSRPGFAGIWDHRFAGRGRAGGAGRPDARRRSARRAGGRSAPRAGAAPAGALAALPALRRRGKIVAVPVARLRAGAGRSGVTVRPIARRAARRAAALPRFRRRLSRSPSRAVHPAVIPA